MAGQAASPLCADLQQRHIQALARRAALHQGAARRLLDERLSSLRAAAVADALEPRPQDPTAAIAARQDTGPLTALLAHMAQQGLTAGAAETGPDRAGSAGSAAAAPRELKAVRDYRSTWSRLSVEQRVNQALARVPPNAGPLNTQRLVHQALTALRDASPAYLHRLVTQVEALLWLERLAQGAPTPKKHAANLARPTESARSSARNR